MAEPPPLRRVDPYRRRGRFYHAVCRFAITRPGLWLASNLAWKLDPILLRLTRGRLSTTGPVAAAVLETRGARTGRLRRTTTLYFHDGERVTIAASNQGRPRHPAWFYNVLHEPRVTFGGRSYRAEVIEDEAERRRLWELADLVFPQFADYRQWAARSGRTIPLVQLAP